MPATVVPGISYSPQVGTMAEMRVSPLLLWRLLLGGFAVAYLASETLQAWLPPLLPFLAAAAVEAQFFVAGLRQERTRGGPVADPGPQPRDLAEFGWASRTLSVTSHDAELVLRPGEMADAEILEWLELHQDELEALGPGRHELAPIDDAESPVAPYVALPVAAPSKVRRRLVQALAVLAVFTAVFFLDRSEPRWQKLPVATRAATISLLDRQAARIAGHPAQVICDTGGRHVGYVQDADGLAEVGGRRMWLTPDVCYRLYRIGKTHRSAGPSSGKAIAVFAHEAWHLHGEGREALANCYAYQSGVAVGQALGLSEQTARQLMREQLADNPSDFAGSPGYVVPEGCHGGGRFDLGLDPGHFP